MDGARYRKSHSISSLEKLTQKLKESNGGVEEDRQQRNRPRIEKRFIGEVT